MNYANINQRLRPTEPPGDLRAELRHLEREMGEHLARIRRINPAQFPAALERVREYQTNKLNRKKK